MALSYIDLSEKHGHRNDHGFQCGAEFNVKIQRRINIPDFVRDQLSESQIDGEWWEEAQRSREGLGDTLRKRYKWIGELAFVGRGPGWLAIEDTGCKPRNWDTIAKIVENHLKAFVASMERHDFWTDIIGDVPSTKKSTHHATKKSQSSKSAKSGRYQVTLPSGERASLFVWTADGGYRARVVSSAGVYSVPTKDAREYAQAVRNARKHVREVFTPIGNAR